MQTTHEPPPDKSSLRQAALRYLERFSATEAGLVRVLDRKIARWARRVAENGDGSSENLADHLAAARQAARDVAQAMVDLGVVNDRLFAESQIRRLARSGHSRRVIEARLMQKGVTAIDRQASLAEAEPDELQAALRYARKRRLGPFRRLLAEDTVQRERGAMARAGFPRDVAERALAMETAQAMSLTEQMVD